MKTLNLNLIALILVSLVKCCPQKDYTKIVLDPFEKAVKILAIRKDSFLKYQKDFNGNDPDFIFLVSKNEFSKIVQMEHDDDFNTIIRLWDKHLLEDTKAALWFMKNGNVYFKIDECRNSRDFLVYDGGEEIMIDVQSDIRKYRIKPNWIYIRMMN